MTTYDQRFMHRAVTIAVEGMQAGDGGPFGDVVVVVVVKDGQILSEAFATWKAKADRTGY